MTAAGKGKVLVLDSDAKRAKSLAERLEFLDYEPISADAAGTHGDLPAADSVAAVVGPLDDERLRELAGQVRSAQPGLPFLCLPGAAPDAAPVERNWALELPLTRAQLERLLKRAGRYRGTERRHRLTGESVSIRQVRKLIEHVADYDTNVLVTGPSGTGKELVARTVHALSERADSPFVPINCGAIPKDLLESELFGHEKGAFTGAVSARTGRFELAEGGTLFLDEIGDMSMDMQVKLLRVLQEKRFERVGCNRSRVCDVRIIAATHRNLPEAVADGTFREDLYYRLNVFPIEMPPLYKRVTDLPMLTQELLVRHDGDAAGGLRVSPRALQALASYPWPGNIRELSNLVERLAIIKPEGTIDVDDLPQKYCASAPAAPVIDNDVSRLMQMSNTSLKEQLGSLEEQLIGQAMQKADGVVAQAARLLGMRRTTLVEKIGKYGLA